MATDPDVRPAGSAKTLRDLITAPNPALSKDKNWQDLSAGMAEAAPVIGDDVCQFLARNPIERRLFYRMFPRRGRPLVWFLVQSGRGNRLVGELVLVQHLLRSESAEDVHHTMARYETELLSSSTLLRRLLGLTCSKQFLADYLDRIHRHSPSA